jgi:hypothetical protein
LLAVFILKKHLLCCVRYEGAMLPPLRGLYHYRPDIDVRLLTTKEWAVATKLGLPVAQYVHGNYLELGRQVAHGAYATERACRRSGHWPHAPHARGMRCLKCDTAW